MAAHKTSAFESDLLLLDDNDLAALAAGNEIRVGSLVVRRLPSTYTWGPQIAARLNEDEWKQHPELWG